MDFAPTLWIDGYSTINGNNDRIPLDLAKSLSSSLLLVHVEQLQLSVLAPGEAFGSSKRRVQGRFQYAKKRYDLWVTDPAYERQYLKQDDGAYSLGPCYLTISLGEPWNDFCYKLIAAIIPSEPT